jgi:hypothetical protein
LALLEEGSNEDAAGALAQARAIAPELIGVDFLVSGTDALSQRACELLRQSGAAKEPR